MEDARAWCEYLFDIFQPYEVYQNSEEITNFPTHETTLNNIRDSRVVIVIVSPVFLDNCSPMLEEYTHQVVALLCGVPEEDLQNIEHKIPSCKNWNIVEAQSGQRNITQVTLRLLDGMSSDAENEIDDYIPMRGDVPEEGPEDTYLTMEGNIADRIQQQQQQQSGGDDDIYLSMQGNVRAGLEPEDEYQTMGGIRQELPEDVYEQMTSSHGNMPEDTYELMTSRGPRMPPKARAHGFESKGHGYVNDKSKSISNLPGFKRYCYNQG